MADKPARKPGWRRPARIAAGVALAIVLIVALVALLRLTVAAWVVDELIAGTPFENATYRITRLDFGTVDVEDLAIDHPVAATISQVRVTYDVFDAIEGRIEAVAIDGLTATVTFDDLAALDDGPEDGGLPVEIGRLTIRNGDALLVIDGEEVRVAMDGEVASLRPLAGVFDLSASGELFDLRGGLDIASADDGGLAITWRIDDGAIDNPNGRLAGLTGDLLVERPGDPARPLALNLTLSSSEVRLDWHDLVELHLEAAALIGTPIGPGTISGQAVLEFGTGTGPVHGRIAATVSREADGAELVVDVDLELNDDLTLSHGTALSIAAPADFGVHAAASLPQDPPPGAIDPLVLALAHVTDLSTQFAAAGLAVDGRFATAAVAGAIAAEHDGGDVSVILTTPVSVAELAVDPSWIAELDLPPELADLLAAPSDLAIASGEIPLTLSHRSDGGGRIDGDLAVTVKSATMHATATFDGNATILADGSAGDALLRNVTVAVDLASFMGATGLHVEAELGASLVGGALETTGQMTCRAEAVNAAGARFTGTTLSFPFQATASGDMANLATSPVVLVSAEAIQLGGVRTGPVEAELPLRMAGMPTSLMVYLEDNGWIDLAGVNHPRFVVNEPVSIRLDQSTLPILALELSGDDDMTWDGRLQLGPPAVSLTVLDDNGLPEAHVSGMLPGVRLHATRLIENYLNVTVESGGGALRWDEQNLEVAGLRMLVTYNTGLSPWPQMRLDVERISDLTSPARIADLTADLRVTPVWPEGDDVRASLNLHAPNKRYALNVEASYEPAKDLATALVRLPPLVFEPGLYQPKDLSPAAGAHFRDVSGSVEVSGEIDWQAGAFASDLNLAIRDLSADAFGTRIERLNTVINFDNVAPLSTPPGQLIAIAGVDAGLPLRDALISIDLNPGGVLVLESAAMKFAGGEVTSGRASWTMGGDPDPIQLTVTGVDVGALFALADMDDLTATGTLDGTIPVRFADGDLVIEDANLASRQPGELHYLPEDVPAGLGADDASIDLVLEALSNFHYERIGVDLDRAAGGETVIGLHIAGANPNLYDGYPIELNVTLTGALDQIVRDSLAGYRIPAEIQERLSGF